MKGVRKVTAKSLEPGGERKNERTYTSIPQPLHEHYPPFKWYLLLPKSRGKKQNTTMQYGRIDMFVSSRKYNLFPTYIIQKVSK
ncbi:hypothetical protein POVWA2_040080 [Plasmodium ovale wallikeri]|uniref:Uncharacterized protein n=1 Tax=Plasmodium ovale wallikeri TaxID=864142 RepID=A0A1A8Z9T0_PLAOA|nr:hypothetical protein POVWA1_041520 [Plasmodium ovale wallikeri]SBT40614.1 hypothetical protein POVWA2_040080 [Plasmodium ovale wallikeri]